MEYLLNVWNFVHYVRIWRQRHLVCMCFIDAILGEHKLYYL